MRQLLLLTVLLALIPGSLAPVAAAGPGLTVAAPKDGETITGNSVTVTFTTSDIKLVPTSVPVAEAGKHPEANRPGEGHLHFVLDLQPLVVWEKAAPYTFDNVPAGEHLLMVELVQNDHSSLAPPVMRQVRFRSSMTGMLPTTGEGTVPLADAGPALLIIAALALVIGGCILRFQRRHR